MSNSILVAALAALVLLVPPLAARGDSGHGDKGYSGPEGGHSGAHAGPASHAASLAGAWTALMAARDAIAADVEGGPWKDIHAKAEPLAGLVDALLDQSGDLDEVKRRRVEGAAKQVRRVADALHVAADGGDAERTRKDLSRLDSLLELIRAQYPAGALDAGGYGHEGDSAAPRNGHGTHAHAERPAGVIDAPPHTTLRVQAFDPLRFEPRRMQMQAGVPTRIQLANAGTAEHSLVVKTPDGTRDWVHLHATPGATEAATYQLNEPGTYPVLCTVPGHTEGGMIGELVVLVGHDGSRPHP